jgi:hypothetical protein
MNTQAQRLVSAITSFILVSTALNFTTPAMAQVSGIINAGKIIKTWILPIILSNCLEEVVKNAMQKFLDFLDHKKVDIKPEDKIRVERRIMPNGKVQTVCQLIRNHKDYGVPFICD